jgi:hypothetical protein
MKRKEKRWNQEILAYNTLSQRRVVEKTSPWLPSSSSLGWLLVLGLRGLPPCWKTREEEKRAAGVLKLSLN